MLISSADHARGSTVGLDQGDHRPAATEYTPLSHFPEDVLSHMFIVGQIHVTMHPSEDHVKTKLLPFELLVSHVNHHWRCVAIATPSLWRNVAVVPEKTIEETQTYLERSKTYPTEIRVDGWPCERPMQPAIVALLEQNIKYWRWVVINVSLDYPYHLLLDHLEIYPAALAHLVHISLSIEGANPSLQYPTPEPDFTQILKLGAPRLEFVRLRGIAPQFYRPPMTTVVTLHIELTKAIPLNHSTLKDILTASPSLTNFSLYGDRIHFPDWPPPGSEPIHLPRLKSLRLWGAHGWIYSNVLCQISAPALYSLYLKEVQESDLEAFWVSPAPHNFPSLRELTFCDFDFSGPSYRKTYTAFPHITKFTVLNTSFEIPIIVRLLGHHSSSARIWPQLQELSVIYNMSDDQQLYDMVVLRAEARTPLVKLRIGTSRPLSTLVGMVPVQRYVEVETFDEPEQWPEGMGYTDEDDVFFQ
ncbi:hypothetical protein PLEOSDRAFT_160514 [Pleurotus ostreatus PC15]|uniref:F-box domain-containing protein n=1 Tax=Pleurotus ostreatus (strain PC15) TaxID=1137138 RepID=A0A067ND24_PLEO1|nr:hypothetical protein PLEOSDRAFT_160514 [Pleurotus ostreatus PC15]